MIARQLLGFTLLGIVVVLTFFEFIHSFLVALNIAYLQDSILLHLSAH